MLEIAWEIDIFHGIFQHFIFLGFLLIYFTNVCMYIKINAPSTKLKMLKWKVSHRYTRLFQVSTILNSVCIFLKETSYTHTRIWRRE